MSRPMCRHFAKNFIRLFVFSAALFLFVSAVSAGTSDEEVLVVLRDQEMTRRETGASARQATFSAAASGVKFVSIYPEITEGDGKLVILICPQNKSAKELIAELKKDSNVLDAV